MVYIEIVHPRMRTQSVHVRNNVVLQLLGAVLEVKLSPTQIYWPLFV